MGAANPRVPAPATIRHQRRRGPDAVPRGRGAAPGPDQHSGTGPWAAARHSSPGTGGIRAAARRRVGPTSRSDHHGRTHAGISFAVTARARRHWACGPGGRMTILLSAAGRWHARAPGDAPRSTWPTGETTPSQGVPTLETDTMDPTHNQLDPCRNHPGTRTLRSQQALRQTPQRHLASAPSTGLEANSQSVKSHGRRTVMEVQTSSVNPCGFPETRARAIARTTRRVGEPPINGGDRPTG